METDIEKGVVVIKLNKIENEVILLTNAIKLKGTF